MPPSPAASSSRCASASARAIASCSDASRSGREIGAPVSRSRATPAGPERGCCRRRRPAGACCISGRARKPCSANASRVRAARARIERQWRDVQIGHAPDLRIYSAAVRDGICVGLRAARECRRKRRTREAQDGLQARAHCLPAAIAHCGNAPPPPPATGPARAGRIAAGFQPHKALHHAGALLRRECRGRCRRPQDRRRAKPALMRDRHPAARRRVFDGIVHQIGQRLRHQAAIAFDHRHAGRRPGVSATFFSSASGSYNSLTSPATEARSSGDMAPRAVPASVSAIRSSALKVPINWSVSAMARSISPVSEPVADSRAWDCSSRWRRRFSGVRRSWATLNR